MRKRPRKKAMQDHEFRERFEDVQRRISNCQFVYHEVKDDNTLYHLEFVAARHFETKYNSFRTH